LHSVIEYETETKVAAKEEEIKCPECKHVPKRNVREGICRQREAGEPLRVICGCKCPRKKK
jgi:hypothetical protein